MADIFYVHWHKAEAEQHAGDLHAAGHSVRSHCAPGAFAAPDPLPDALVISLDRLPSHGREVAGWFWQARKRQSIPIVFVGGEAEKAAALRSRFPRAVFCARRDLARVLGSLAEVSPKI